MSALGQKQTSDGRPLMSALPPKADIVRFAVSALVVARLNCGHLPEFLTVFRDMSPVLRAVAIDVHFRIEPTRVIKSPSFDKPEVRHHSDL